MIGFDTLRAMESLRDSGFEESQARAVVDTFKDAVAGSVATKADLQEVKAELQAEIQEVRTGLEASIASLRSDVEASIAGLRGEVEASIAGLRGEMEASIAGLRGEMETSIARLEARTQRFMFGMALGIVGLNVTLTFGLLKFFF